MNYSPAPWRWIPQIEDSEDMPILVDANNQKVCDFGNCTTYYPLEGTPPNDENAILISSAPEMLEALENLLIHALENDLHSEFTDKAQEIIKNIKCKP